MSLIPATPAVEVIVSRQDVILPAAAAELLRRGECSVAEAGEFLGFAVKADGSAGSTVYAMADRYRRRTQAVMYDERGYPRPYDPRDHDQTCLGGLHREDAQDGDPPRPGLGLGLVPALRRQRALPPRLPA